MTDLVPSPAAARLPGSLAAMPEFLSCFRSIARDVTQLPGAPGAAAAPRDGEAVDREAEESFLAAIQDSFPGAAILSEELFRRDGTVIAGRGDLRVLLDPLDGTRSYSAGSDVFSCTIAFEVGGELVCGAIYHPPSDRCFVAVRGGGAWVNGSPLRARRTPARIVALRSTFRTRDLGERLENRLTALGYATENLQCTSLKLCMTAQGQRSGVVKRISRSGSVLQPWGVAAGALLCAECDIAVAEFGGDSWTTGSDSFVAGVADVHHAVRAAAATA